MPLTSGILIGIVAVFFWSGNVPWNSAEEDCRYFDLFRARRGPAGDRHRGVGDQLGDVIA